MPLVHPNPRRADSCVRCAGVLSPEWTSNDRTVRDFYDALEAGCGANVSDAFHTFRDEAMARERAGRPYFGYRHLGRDSLVDAREEAADGGNYFLFDHLKTIRQEGRDDDIALVLEGAKKFYEAYEIAMALRHRRKGAP